MSKVGWKWERRRRREGGGRGCKGQGVVEEGRGEERR
jgi:hypothetical protein